MVREGCNDGKSSCLHSLSTAFGAVGMVSGEGDLKFGTDGAEVGGERYVYSLGIAVKCANFVTMGVICPLE